MKKTKDTTFAIFIIVFSLIVLVSITSCKKEKTLTDSEIITNIINTNNKINYYSIRGTITDKTSYELNPAIQGGTIDLDEYKNNEKNHNFTVVNTTNNLTIDYYKNNKDNEFIYNVTLVKYGHTLKAQEIGKNGTLYITMSSGNQSVTEVYPNAKDYGNDTYLTGLTSLKTISTYIFPLLNKTGGFLKIIRKPDGYLIEFSGKDNTENFMSNTNESNLRYKGSSQVSMFFTKKFVIKSLNLTSTTDYSNKNSNTNRKNTNNKSNSSIKVTIPGGILFSQTSEKIKFYDVGIKKEIKIPKNTTIIN